MHIETLKTYCDLVETRSFSQAAALNLVTQSAVSQQVRALERRYGQMLLERGRGKGVVPTEAGRNFYTACKDLLDRFFAAETALRERSTVIAGTVRVATVYSVGLHDLPPYVKQFIKDHPQVNVRLEYSRTNRIYEACLNDEIEFGVVAYPSRRPQLEIIHFREDTLVLICGPDHQLSGGTRISLKRLDGMSFVGFERDIPTRKAIDRLFRQFRVKVDYVMEFDNIETIKRSVEAGIGISILPETAVVNEARAGLLITRRFAEGDFRRPIGIIHRRGRILSPAAAAFLRFLTRRQKVLSAER
jgi:DNA-binding transcriptional LysR family regulator